MVRLERRGEVLCSYLLARENKSQEILRLKLELIGREDHVRKAGEVNPAGDPTENDGKEICKEDRRRLRQQSGPGNLLDWDEVPSGRAFPYMA